MFQEWDNSLELQFAGMMVMDIDSDLEAELDELILSENKMNDNEKESEKAVSIIPPTTETEQQLCLPAATVEIITTIKQRIEMYELAASNAKANEELAKVRRCERGLKILSDLLRNALTGKPVNVDDIPTEVSVKSAPACNENAATTMSNGS